MSFVLCQSVLMLSVLFGAYRFEEQATSLITSIFQTVTTVKTLACVERKIRGLSGRHKRV